MFAGVLLIAIVVGAPGFISNALHPQLELSEEPEILK
jgi:hypothetical protein